MRINPSAYGIQKIPFNEKSISDSNRLNQPKHVVETPRSSEENLDALMKVYGEKQLKKIGMIECETCANRTYIDGSDDPGVSFKTPGKIDPDISAAVVMSHELEHVRNEQATAKSENREVVSQSVSLSTSICPECGKVYVSGGNTKTVTKGESPYEIPSELLKGSKIDKEV